MYRLWCEYDFGQENIVFTSEEAAWNWLEVEIRSNDFDDSVQTLRANGLAGVTKLEVIS